MKTFRLLILMLMISSTALAGGNRISVGYENSKLTNMDMLSTSEFLSSDQITFEKVAVTLNGAGIAYSRSFELTKSGLLCMEFGLGASYGFYGVKSGYATGTEIDVFENTITTFAVRTPINISYRVPLTHKISLEPYAGLSIKVNCIASANYKHSDNSDSDTDYDYTYNLLDDVSTTNSWGIGRLEGQIGLGVNISKVYLGVVYSSEFSSSKDAVGYSTLGVRAGLNF